MIPVKQYVPIAILDGATSVGTAGTRVQVTTANTPCFSITLTAGSANTGIMCIGGTTVTASTGTARTGLPLNAGDTAIIELDNVNKIWLDSTVSGDKASYYYKA